jgi:hypothetical protein
MGNSLDRLLFRFYSTYYGDYSMSTPGVYAIYGDIGGAKEVLPAVQLLAKEGVLVKHFVLGERARAGTDVLEPAGVSYEKRGPETGDKPAVIVCGTSETAPEGLIEWTKFGRDRSIPVIWVEDLWGAGEHKRTQVVSPNVMCVIDEIAAHIAQGVRPDIQTEVVGKPSFAALAKKLENVEQIRETTRAQLAARLGIRNFEGKIVTYGSGGEVPARAYLHLKALCEDGGLGSYYDGEVIFVPRFHPKLAEDDKRRLRVEALKVGAYVVMAHDLDMDFVTVASDVNIGDWGSTSMYTSAIFGIPPVMCMFPDDIERRLGAGYPDGEPPLLIAKAGSGAIHAASFRGILNEILSKSDHYWQVTFEYAAPFRKLLEPGAEERIVEVVKRYM